jgi:hypothetical protein
MGISVKRIGQAVSDDQAVLALLGAATRTEFDVRSGVRELCYAPQDDARIVEMIKSFLGSDLRQRGCWLEVK